MDLPGVIGNCETCAMVDSYGSLVWMCAPKFDGKIIFAKLLDPKSGPSLDLTFNIEKKQVELKPLRQRYVKRANILHTILENEQLHVMISDAMPLGKRLLSRRVTITNKSTDELNISLDWELNKGIFNFTEKNTEDFKIYSYRKNFFGYRPVDSMIIKPKTSKFRFLCFSFGESYKEVEKQLNLKVKPLYIETKKFWIDWCNKSSPLKNLPKLQTAFERSLLIMKLLTYEKSGATIAAATSSLPAVPFGKDNWDYRFVWIRDSFLVIKAFILSGHFEDAKKQIEFFFSLQSPTGEWIHPLYTVDGKIVPKELILNELAGPQGETPVRIGNAASEQLQLDSAGSVIFSVLFYYRHTKEKEFVKENWSRIKKAAEWIEENYMLADSGLWEFRQNSEHDEWWGTGIKHFTHSKAMCYVAINTASKLGNVIGEDFHSTTKALTSHLKKEILKNSWDKIKQSYVQQYGHSPIDISVLSLGEYGIVNPRGKRFSKTIDAISEKLSMSGGIKRHEQAVMPFYLPTFWLAQHYLQQGKVDKGKKMINLALKNASKLGLFAEHFNPDEKKQYGNYPQSFCAASFVEAVKMLDKKLSKMKNLN